jgi:hypothetical protein
MDENNKEMEKLFSKNPFEGYLERIKRVSAKDGQTVNPVHEVVNTYYKSKGLDGKPKKFYEGRNSYAKLARESKKLLEGCNGSLDDALWSLDKMKYLADKKGFDWSISTCLKHDLNWSGGKKK